MEAEERRNDGGEQGKEPTPRDAAEEDGEKQRKPSPSRAEFDDEGAEQALGAATDEQLRQQEGLGPEGMDEDEDGKDDDEQQVMGESDEDVDENAGQAERSDAIVPERQQEVDAPAAAGPPKQRENDQDAEQEAEGGGAGEELAPRGYGALEPMEESDEDEEAADAEANADGLIPQATPEELRSDMEARLAQLGAGERAQGEQVWQDCTALTRGLAAELAEQLRLLLLPSRATSLVGDFRTGKRINMKRVIPYIASDFKKDKIWLRRKKPTKRNYQIMVAIDDSRSMRDHRKGQMALEALATITTALTTLEAGQLAVAKFGAGTQLLHAFDGAWSDARGAEVCGAFSFGEAETDVHGLLDTILTLMQAQRDEGGREEQQQLAFIVSDGLLTSRGAALAQLVSQAAEEGVMLVFVLIDNQGEGDTGSVLDIQSIVQHKGRMARKLYMDSFPFPFYVVLKDLTSLPMVLADALRQWIELMPDR